MTKENDIKLYSMRDISEILGISIQTIRRKYVKNGDLKVCEIGKRYYVTGEAFKEFIKAHEGKKDE